MKSCPHCGRSIGEAVPTCPFCKVDLVRPWRSSQTDQEAKYDFPAQEHEVEKKEPRRWLHPLVVVLLALALGVLLAERALIRSGSNSIDLTPWLEAKDKELEERSRRIQELEDQAAELRRDLEGRAKQLAESRAELEETKQALSSAQKRLSAAQTVERPSPPAVALPERRAPRATEAPPAPVVRRRPAEPGTYETARTTFVFEEPVETSRRLSTIRRGTKVEVVGSAGEWLEIRSKHDNPPGFIRRDDAYFVEASN